MASLFVTIGFTISILFSAPLAIRCFFLILYGGMLSLLYGRLLQPRASFFLQTMSGLLFLGTTTTLVLWLIYMGLGFHSWFVPGLVVVHGIIGTLLHYKQPLHLPKLPPWKWNLSPAFLLIPLGLALAVLGIIIRARTGGTLTSPWIIVRPIVFPLFVSGIFSALLLAKNSKCQKLPLFLLPLFFLIFVSVVTFILGYGFGFDHHIHQASEQWILDHGFIAPKTPYYIGQYMMVLVLHLGTGIRLTLIDTCLLPFLSAILLPFSALLVARRFLPESRWFQSTLLLLVCPLPFFIQTTPNNLALLFAVFTLSLFLSTLSQKEKNISLLITLLALTVFSIHPFIGLPLCVFLLGSTLYNRIPRRSLLLTTMAGVTLITPLALYIHGISTHSVTLVSPLAHLDTFIQLFRHPEWYTLSGKPYLWQLLYYTRDILIPLCLALAAYGFFTLKQTVPAIAKILVTSVIGLWISAFILATTIRMQGVISYEAGGYASRLISLGLLFLFPLMIIGWGTCMTTIQKKHIIIQGSILLLLSVLIGISWYMTYPTRDVISRYGGYSVRDADIATVRFIRDRNPTSTDYIVIANQMLGAAAMREMPFARYHNTALGLQFFYSIPTGGPLYTYFGKMVYEAPTHKTMDEAMQFAGVKKAYFVHTNYWYPAAQIRDEAKKEADAWFTIRGGEAWVYEYILSSTSSVSSSEKQL